MQSLTAVLCLSCCCSCWFLHPPQNNTTTSTVFVSYALVSLTDAVLYTNPSKVTPEVAAQLQEGGVVVRPYDALVADVKGKAAQGTKIAMDLARVSARVKE